MHKKEFENYLLSEKRFSINTVTAYLNDLNQFFDFITNSYGVLLISEINHKHIRAWLVCLVTDVGISNSSVNRKMSSIKTYYRFLSLSEIVVGNPTAKVIVPKVGKRLPEFVGQSSMDKLLNEEMFSDDFEGCRDHLILEVLYQTGIRLSELISITVDDVRSAKGYIKVLGKRNKQRIVPVNVELLNLCSQYLSFRSEINVETNLLLITKKGRAVYPKLIYKTVNSYLGKVSTVSKKSPHILRHTFATHMLNNGADLNSIKELLGHANLSATQVYTHNSFEKLKSIYNQAHPRA